MLGQVLDEKRAIEVRGAGSDFLKVGSALASAPASHCVIAPMIADGDVTGNRVRFVLSEGGVQAAAVYSCR